MRAHIEAVCREVVEEKEPDAVSHQNSIASGSTSPLGEQQVTMHWPRYRTHMRYGQSAICQVE